MNIRIKQTKSDGRLLVTWPSDGSLLVTGAFGVEAVTGRLVNGGAHMRIDASRIGELKIPTGGRLEIEAI